MSNLISLVLCCLILIKVCVQNERNELKKHHPKPYCENKVDVKIVVFCCNSREQMCFSYARLSVVSAFLLFG